jgi:hypothetical protein
LYVTRHTGRNSKSVNSAENHPACGVVVPATRASGTEVRNFQTRPSSFDFRSSWTVGSVP